MTTARPQSISGFTRAGIWSAISINSVQSLVSFLVDVEVFFDPRLSLRCLASVSPLQPPLIPAILNLAINSSVLAALPFLSMRGDNGNVSSLSPFRARRILLTISLLLFSPLLFLSYLFSCPFRRTLSSFLLLGNFTCAVQLYFRLGEEYFWRFSCLFSFVAFLLLTFPAVAPGVFPDSPLGDRPHPKQYVLFFLPFK